MTERITNLLSEHKLAQLKELLNDELGFQELSELLEEFSPNQQVILFRLLEKDTALEIFELMETAKQKELLQAFTAIEVTEMVSNIDPSDQVRLLDELPATVAKELLKSIPPEDREKASILIGFQPGTVGRVMSPHYLRLRQDYTVQAALDYIRALKPDPETLHNVWVTDKRRVLEGVVTLRDLVLADPGTSIGDIMDDDVVYVTADTDQEDAVNTLKKFDLVSLPVVDSENRLVGALEYDRALDIMQEEATEDLLEKGGVLTLQRREENLSQRLLHGSLWKVLSARLPFLMITLVGDLFAGMIVSGFESALSQVLALAFFLPLIMDMSGNVGSQSTTIFTRSLVLGHIRPNEFKNTLLSETGRGLAIGGIIGVITAIVATVWQGDYRLGLVVGLSLWCALTLSATLGFLVPWVMNKMGLDQAAGAGPILTTILDIVALLIYFYLAVFFMDLII
ncbi:MAG TPA: magnesium transporter [Firmicutes bacterium]|nr:magnesium transporter [Bacillota bacterium]